LILLFLDDEAKRKKYSVSTLIITPVKGLKAQETIIPQTGAKSMAE
jgi:hypothetical protein